MCGLVGMAGDLSAKHRDVMKDLLFLDTLRGRDSTGVAAIRRDRKVELRKLTVPGFEFVEMPFINDLLKFNDQLWIGHNRYKTRGNVSRMNAHPFEVLDEDDCIRTIGAHNGTLTNQDEIEKILGNRFGTDSEGLINLIDSVGIEAAIKEAQGAWSLVWWDAPENTINFLRNDERPMYFAFTEDRKVLIWASEAWMILNTCSRRDVKLQLNKDKRPEIWSTLPDTHYSWKIPQAYNVRFDEVVKKGGLSGKPARSNFSSTNWQGRSASNGNGDYRNNAQFWDAVEKGKAPGTEEKKANGQTGTNVVTLGVPNAMSHPKKGYMGEPVTQIHYDNVKEGGCGWCGGALSTGFAWLDKNTGCCTSCVGGMPASRLMQ